MNISVVEYVIVPSHAKRVHKLQSKSRGLMLVKDAKSDLVFTVGDLVNTKKKKS